MSVETQFTVRCDVCLRGFRVAGAKSALAALMIIKHHVAEWNTMRWQREKNPSGDFIDICPDCGYRAYVAKMQPPIEKKGAGLAQHIRSDEDSDKVIALSNGRIKREADNESGTR